MASLSKPPSSVQTPCPLRRVHRRAARPDTAPNGRARYFGGGNANGARPPAPSGMTPLHAAAMRAT